VAQGISCPRSDLDQIVRVVIRLPQFAYTAAQLFRWCIRFTAAQLVHQGVERHNPKVRIP